MLLIITPDDIGLYRYLRINFYYDWGDFLYIKEGHDCINLILEEMN